MGVLLDLNERLPHKVDEVICLKCLTRWIAVFPEDVPLVRLECPKCGEVGFTISTGQDMEVLKQ